MSNLIEKISTPADEVLGQEVDINSTREPEAEASETAHDYDNLSGTKRILVLVGLLLSIFVFSLDVTIVSTALVRIVAEFDGNTSITTWVATAYLLTSVAMQPLYGKMSDIFGRKFVLLFALSFFLLGSAGCGAATDATMLIIFRAIAGIGGGGLFSLSIIVISDITPPKSRGFYLALAGGIFSIASIVGPLIGGSFADGLSWRWAFYINLPICAVTFVVVLLFLNLSKLKSDLTLKEKVLSIDFLGIFTLFGFSICFVLGLTWGGEGNNWNSAPTISTLVIAFVFLIAFIVVEAKFARDPIISKNTLNRNTIVASINNFSNGAIILVFIYYLPIYYQAVKGTTATTAGLELLPLLLSSISGFFITGFATYKTGRYVFMLIIGNLLQILGVGLLLGMFRESITRPEEIIYTLIIGLGLGISYQNNTVVAQAAVPQEEVATVTSMLAFTNQLGSVVSLALQGSIYSSVLSSGLNNLKSLIPELNLEAALSVEKIAKLPEANLTLVRGVYIDAFRAIYTVILVLTCLSTAIVFFAKHIPLRS